MRVVARVDGEVPISNTAEDAVGEVGNDAWFPFLRSGKRFNGEMVNSGLPAGNYDAVEQ